ncbi:2-C-methyl-D-erythritol 4-phosphate cytidylyltransferase [Dickeya zeae]|jgi:2-C-methyl-D-erythritol 4-phosphate cytidylyltransferase|uniref:2-C-methyl-D-erythritol 4-phosphate cytidylyltransferase n=1 Tax=Dickeya zeae TaxID=204042 RepID=A0AAE7CXS4_9GAMM|nr:2-C-methyl-D-erythritol 4-phosphate cytidylyltransferase [Dickeya zeae]PXW46045.1 2-C-methyl-D-erythritol 4-phosphate cytidylyltransferase [Erwinia sp. AG740]AUQ26567.1 2-C-methyl-D-erythritol 4-phosphate cytidylyltransferase [Dickeya zeae]QIZ50136.1 2-C-methyl-D-erythritol 4-phosphate cytidylyltransferase [Dickeya zeae]QYM93799.1 2-C-methyl-D-erythritol 4-phosphate cytidylyltransferase [Dickeya zeae]UJR59626.1 2-C-methyl-D-erythritol 4-phosphate cytidylyltransferase [Dickeya zeae]
MSTLNHAVAEVVAVLPAAGNGSRMLSDRPKQYLSIGTKTILEHTVAALLRQPRIQRIIIAISADDPYFSALPLASDPRIQVVIGGRQRADSVLAGLQQVQQADWVLVHDAARPCLHQDDLSRLLLLTGQSEVGGILAAPVRDTMKRSRDGHIDHTVEREALWHALTPQLFPLALLRSCLERALREGATITDEASALEYCGYQPQIVPGRADNIKVTRPEDLALAEFYLTRSLDHH